MHYCQFGHGPKHFENLKSIWRLNDKRLDDYLNKRFYDGVLSCILFNLMYTNCPLSQKQKKEVLNTIIRDPYTIEAFEYADHVNLVQSKDYIEMLAKSRAYGKLNSGQDYLLLYVQ